MKRKALKYTGNKTSVQLGSAMVPESTLVLTTMTNVKVVRSNSKPSKG